MSNGNKYVKLRFILMQVFYWCGMASFFSFMVAYMRSRGINASFIGLTLAGYRLSSVFGQFFWGNICDKFQTNKKVFLFTNFLNLAFSVLFFFSASAQTMMVWAVFLGFCQTPTYTNMDTWLLKYYGGRSSVYGPVRAIGTLAFAIFIFFYGKLIADYGYGIMPYFMAVFITLNAINAFMTPEGNADGTVKKVKLAPIKKSDLAELFAKKEFVFLIIILFFDGLALAGVGQMKTLVWERLTDAVPTYIGYDLFVSTAFQAILLFSINRFGKISAYKRLGIAVTFDFIYLAVVYMATVPQVVIAATVLAGLSGGLLISSMREVIVKSAPERLATTAQGIGDACFTSLSGMTGAISAGLVIDNFGVRNLVLCSVMIQIVPLVLILLNSRKKEMAADS